MLMIWFNFGCSVTFETLGKALMDTEMKRDDLFFKHCKEEKQLSKWFTITPQGGQVSYLGCTIDIPEGSIESEAELCLGFLKTGPPEGDCVAPVLHVQTKPSNLSLKKPVTMTLPLFVSPVEPDESSQSELTLMCFSEGLWNEVPTPNLSFSQASFEVTHFSAWTIIITILKIFGYWYSRSLACYLFGKGIPESNVLDMRMCVCGNVESERQRLQEIYKDYVKLDVAGDNFVVSRGHDVVVSSYIEPPHGAVTAAHVTPEIRILKSKNFESELVMQVARFDVNMEPPIPIGTKVVCGLAERDERNPPCEPSVTLQFHLKIYEKKQTADKEKKKITSCGSASDSSDEPVEKKSSKKYEAELARGEEMKVVLLCDEWDSSKGGLSTFNRLLSINLAKRTDLNVFCYLPKFSGVEEKDARENRVALIEAPQKTLLFWPRQQFSPDVIISHGRKFGCAAFFIKDRYPSCKWVHFVHVNCEEMGKYKVGSNEIRANNQKDSEELIWCTKADVVVAVGPQLLDRYSRSLSMEEKKVEVFYPGLSNEFLNLPQKEIENKEFHILICCRCSSEDFELKGVDLLADAVGKLGKNYKVHVVGVPANEEVKTFQHTIKNTAVTKDQLYMREYCDNREELKRMICEADLVVMPSRAEAFGLIGLEALSAGVPLLVSAASGFGMTLQELDFGDNFVVESDEPEEWAKKIESVKEKGKSRRFREINHVRNQYGEIYKWEEQCSRLVKFFCDD